MIYKVCRIINVVCAVLTSVLFIDLLILPKIEKNEKVVSREAVYYSIRERYGGSREVKSDYRTMITENYQYPIETYQQFEYWKCDSIRLLITPILREVNTGFVELEGKKYELPSKGSIFRDLVFIPIVFGLCSLAGVLLRNDKEQVINFAIVNVIIFVLMLYVMRGI